MSASSSSAAAADPSNASEQFDFVLICIPAVSVDEETDSGTPRFGLEIISAMPHRDDGVDNERRWEIVNDVRASMNMLITDFVRSFVQTIDSEFTEDTHFNYLVALSNEWPTIQATAKSIHEGVNFSVELRQAEELLAWDPEDESETNGGPSGEKASVAENDVDSEEKLPTDEGKGKQRAEDPTEESASDLENVPQDVKETSGPEVTVGGSNSDSEEKLTYKGKGKQRADD
jgi:hypothetical protein